MGKLQTIEVPGWSRSSPYAHAVRHKDTVYVSGLVGQAPDGTIPESLEEQMNRILSQLDEALAAIGAERSDIMMNYVFLKSSKLFREMNTIYRKTFADHLPARCTVSAELMHPNLLVEIQSVVAIE